jgi:hypothetical protein
MKAFALILEIPGPGGYTNHAESTTGPTVTAALHQLRQTELGREFIPPPETSAFAGIVNLLTLRGRVDYGFSRYKMETVDFDPDAHEQELVEAAVEKGLR